MSDPVREWIVQRCINAFRNEYGDWSGYCARLMTREEMKAAFVECAERWPEYGFRGHGGEPAAREGQVTRREVSAERPSRVYAGENRGDARRSECWCRSRSRARGVAVGGASQRVPGQPFGAGLKSVPADRSVAEAEGQRLPLLLEGEPQALLNQRTDSGTVATSGLADGPQQRVGDFDRGFHRLPCHRERKAGHPYSDQLAGHIAIRLELRAHGGCMNIDTDQVDEAVLALLQLGLHEGNRAWKEFDWDAMQRLHAKGYISDPVGKAKSVVFTDTALRESERLRERFGRSRERAWQARHDSRFGTRVATGRSRVSREASSNIAAEPRIVLSRSLQLEPVIEYRRRQGL